MNIYIPAIYHKINRGGKEFFCKRLAKAFQKLNINIIKNWREEHDLSLHVTKIEKDKKEVKKILRLNGVYHNLSQDYKKLNINLKKNMHKPDAIVYQSLFSKKICDKYIGKFQKPITIISNGFDSSIFDDIKPTIRKYKYNFLSFSRWRPHKRLIDIIKCFKLAAITDSCLYIAGDISVLNLTKKDKKKYLEKIKNIIYLGKIKEKEIYRYLKICDAFIHLCWIDNCPNAVIEAIAAGRTVITNNVGGTKEIVEPSGGIVCKIDKPYNLEPCRLYEPPKFDYNIVINAMKQVIKEKRKIYKKHIEMEDIARQYKKFFEYVLGKK